MLKKINVEGEVIAPSSIPRRSGDRVKTDRRDARKLATLHTAGLLTPVRVPDSDDEAARALLRCRSTLVEDLNRARKRTTHLLLSRGLAFKGTNWSQRFWAWLSQIPLEAVDQAVYLYRTGAIPPDSGP